MTGARGHTGAALLALGLSAAGGALAAGGHHNVDDANTLPTGRCEQEDWITRGQGGPRLLHGGLNCGVGPVELGIAVEHTSDHAPSATFWNVEAKWATEVADGLKVGFDVQPVRQSNQQPHYALTRFVGLATWSPSAAWALHLNLGHDFVHDGPDFARSGVGVDWSPIDRWTFTGEAYTDTGTRFLRAGARWSVTDRFTVDVSRGQHLRGPAPSNLTLGVTFAFQ